MIKNRVVNNAAWIIGCRIIQAIMNLVITLISARYLDTSGFGTVNYATAIVAFVIPLMQLGLNSIIVQELVAHPEEEGKIMGSSIFMSFIMSFLTILGVISFVLIANRGETDTLIVCALCSLQLIFQSFDHLRYWFQAKFKSKYSAVVVLISYFVVNVYKALILFLYKNIYLYVLSTVLEYLIIAVLLLVCYKKLGAERLSFSKQTSKRLINKGKFYILSNLMIIVFSMTDRIMLKLMIDDSATGIYSGAALIAGMTSFVFIAIIDSTRPSIFESKKVNELEYENKIIRLNSVVIYLALAQSVFLTVLAGPIVNIMLGEKYTEAVVPLMVVVWYTTFAYTGSVRGIWMLAENKQHILWVINLVGALLNVVLNLVFIKIWGIVGASVASLITQVFTNVIMNMIIPSLRRVNVLYLKSLNPKYLVEMVKEFFAKEKSKKTEDQQ